MKPADAADYVVGVIGAGAMGQGIAQVSITSGARTILYDAKPGAVEAARAAIEARVARLAERGQLPGDGVARAMSCLELAADVTALAPCDAVIEAVFEDLDVKRALFRQVEAVIGPDAIIASNTSSIPIASIARACERRHRVAGMHFFNPVPLMKLVEIIQAAETSEQTLATLDVLGRRFGRTPVRVKDSPGFLVNFGGRAFTTEGLRLAHEGVAIPAQIDAVMRDCRGFRMGPFELMDLTGIDVNFPVSLIVYDGYMQDPRLKTAPNHKALFDAGLLGRKTGQGWFRYHGAEKIDPPSPDHLPERAVATTDVALAAPDPKLEAFCASVGLAVASDDGARPILAAPLGDDAIHTVLATGADFRRLVCLDLYCNTAHRVTIMTAPGVDPAARDAVAASLIAAGRRVTAISDSPGFIAQRIAGMVANLGCYMAEIGLGTPADIDTAMRLGLSYPLGPLELAEDIGPAKLLRIMERLQAITGEDRYRSSLWLKRRAALGLPVHTPH
jgi:3-hydroxybutyryl-CoA dehydrogenase